MSRLKNWIEAMRLRTLPVSVAGVFAGCGCAAFYGSFRWLPAIICLTFAVIAQIVANFANEYYDFKNGLDRKGREGFRRGVTEGDITPAAMSRATYGLLAIDCLIGCSLLYYGGWWLLAVGVCVALFAMAYSTGPYPLSHHGLGDIAVVVFFGIVPVVFTCYVQTGVWDWHSITFPIGAAVGLLAANVLIVNNYRDMEDDKSVGKHTTVVLFGRTAMGQAYLWSGFAAAALIAIPLWHSLSAGWLVALGLWCLLHIFLWYSITRSRGKALNPLLGKTALSLLLASILLLIALATR